MPQGGGGLLDFFFFEYHQANRVRGLMEDTIMPVPVALLSCGLFFFFFFLSARPAPDAIVPYLRFGLMMVSPVAMLGGSQANDCLEISAAAMCSGEP